MAKESPAQAARRKQHPVTIVKAPAVKKVAVPKRKAK
jgi:hypothetical protein